MNSVYTISRSFLQSYGANTVVSWFEVGCRLDEVCTISHLCRSIGRSSYYFFEKET